MTDSNEGTRYQAADFARDLTVSRETMARLDLYHSELLRWNKAINLVSPATLNDAWRRHFLDSAQLLSHAPETARSWLDLGSGAGFPGLVIAILALEKRPDLSVTLVESDRRKAVFLKEVARKTGASCTVLNSRIEAVAPFRADIVSARALASLDLLLDWTAPFCTDATVCLFLKGETAKDELTEAGKKWHIDASLEQSRADPRGVLLRIARFHRGDRS